MKGHYASNRVNVRCRGCGWLTSRRRRTGGDYGDCPRCGGDLYVMGGKADTWTVWASYVLGGWQRTVNGTASLLEAITEGINRSPIAQVTIERRSTDGLPCGDSADPEAT